MQSSTFEPGLRNIRVVGMSVIVHDTVRTSSSSVFAIAVNCEEKFPRE